MADKNEGQRASLGNRNPADGGDARPLAFGELKGLVDRVPGAVFRAEIDAEGRRRFSFVSSGIEALCGCAAETLCRTGAPTFVERIFPEDRDRIAAAIDRAVCAQTGYTVSYRLNNGAGRWRRVRENGRALRDDEGRLWIEGALTDIHDQWYAEAVNHALMRISSAMNATSDLDELYWSIHQALDSLLDLSNFAIAIYNRQADRIDFPYFVDQMDEKFPVIHGLADSPALCAEVIRTGRPLMIDREAIKARTRRLGKPPPGSRCKIWLGAPLIVDEQVIGTVLTQSYTDENRFGPGDMDLLISVSAQVAQAIERKRRDQAIAESAKLYRESFLAIPDPIIIIRADDGRILNINEAFCRMTGYAPEDVLNRQVGGLGFFVSEDERRRLTRRTLRQGWARGQVARCRHKNGLILDMMYSLRCLNIDGEPCLVAAARDVTEIRAMERAKQQLEVQFHQAQKMEALGTLAGGIAHDFNNLLMGIQGNVSLLRMGGALDPADAERLENIERYVGSGSKLTRQLLGFARKEYFEIKPVDLNAVIEKSVDLFGRAKKEIIIHLDLDSALWTALADVGQIEQVLLNLCVNASHAMPAGGNLRVRTRNADVDDSRGQTLGLAPGLYTEVSVADTGHGMDEQTLRRIFEPFFTTKAKDRGTGLGLASAYGIIEKHGGIIAVESRPGIGSTFTFYLPATDTGERSREQAEERTDTGSETILLVDDEPMVLEVAAEMMKKLGYRVEKANDGATAVAAFDRDPDAYDLVVLDMVMPGMGGRDVFRRLRQTRPGVRILVSSGFSPDQELESLLEHSGTGFVQKPYNMAKLSSSVRALLDAGDRF